MGPSGIAAPKCPNGQDAKSGRRSAYVIMTVQAQSTEPREYHQGPLILLFLSYIMNRDYKLRDLLAVLALFAGTIGNATLADATMATRIEEKLARIGPADVAYSPRWSAGPIVCY